LHNCFSASTVTEMRKGRGAGECYEQCRSSYGSSDSLYSACSEGCNSYRCVNFGRNLKTPLEKKDVVVDPVTAIKKDLSPVTDIKKVPGITTKRPAVSVRPGAQDKVTALSKTRFLLYNLKLSKLYIIHDNTSNKSNFIVWMNLKNVCHCKNLMKVRLLSAI
jgi:hypothetical protein